MPFDLFNIYLVMPPFPRDAIGDEIEPFIGSPGVTTYFDLSNCACCGGVISSCIDCLGFTVPRNLFLTYTYNGYSLTVPLNLASSSPGSAAWSSDFGGTWQPYPGGPIFNIGYPFDIDRLFCACPASPNCGLRFHFIVKNAGGLDVTHDAVQVEGSCGVYEPIMTLASSSPFHLVGSVDLDGLPLDFEITT